MAGSLAARSRPGRPVPSKSAASRPRHGPQSSMLVKSWRGPRRGRVGVPSLRCHQIRLGYIPAPGGPVELPAVIRSSRPSPSQSTATGWAITSAVLGLLSTSAVASTAPAAASQRPRVRAIRPLERVSTARTSIRPSPSQSASRTIIRKRSKFSNSSRLTTPLDGDLGSVGMPATRTRTSPLAVNRPSAPRRNQWKPGSRSQQSSEPVTRSSRPSPSTSANCGRKFAPLHPVGIRSSSQKSPKGTGAARRGWPGLPTLR
jgi:hypothetical protein